MADLVKVLGFAGSLRQESFNRALLRTAMEVAPANVKIETFDLTDIPLYNGDVETVGMPAPLQHFRTRIGAADALLIATPEYNYSIPGVLKNAIDWASRPPDQPFAGKSVALMGASPGMLGTARSQYHLRQVAVFLDMRLINTPEVFVAAAHTKFDASGRLTDEPTRERVRTLLATLADWTQRLRAGDAA